MSLSTKHIKPATIFGGILLLSLMSNAVQFLKAREDAPFAQLGRNLLATELLANAMKIGDGYSCGTVGALLVAPGESKALACGPSMKWEPAHCKDKGVVNRDDQGRILVCDGLSWTAS